tara:strand:- start:39 stop:494 length:456 start_codon:yes stop_codon:yes gene_type:complete
MEIGETKFMSNLIYLLNGPNLNLLGKRQPEIYGSETLAAIRDKCVRFGNKHNYEVFFDQTNSESQLIDWIHEAIEKAHAIIINAGAYTHTSIAIFDALNMFEGQVIEVHISNIYKREKFRQHSFVSLRADKVIVGKGTEGYLKALSEILKS